MKYNGLHHTPLCLNIDFKQLELGHSRGMLCHDAILYNIGCGIDKLGLQHKHVYELQSIFNKKGKGKKGYQNGNLNRPNFFLHLYFPKLFKKDCMTQYMTRVRRKKILKDSSLTYNEQNSKTLIQYIQQKHKQYNINKRKF